MYTLKSTTQHNIEVCTSIPFSQLIAMEHDDEQCLLKPANGGEIVFSSKRDSRKIGRGNPLLARRRFKTMEEVNQKLTEISNANLK